VQEAVKVPVTLTPGDDPEMVPLLAVVAFGNGAFRVALPFALKGAPQTVPLIENVNAEENDPVNVAVPSTQFGIPVMGAVNGPNAPFP
jgi:hypothetical protein